MADLRLDGTPKGPGFLGSLPNPGGDGYSTELSIGVNLEGGPEIQIPTLVPTLTQDEIDYLLVGYDPTKEIVDKAIEHAMKRKREGLSIFAEEEPQKPKPEFKPETESQKEVNRFGDPIEETPQINRFGDVIYNPKDLKWEKPLPLGQRLIDKYARPTLQGLGSTVGIIFGGGGGGIAGTAVAPGPGTAVGTMAGAVAGEALGYAMGDEIADLLQEWLGYYKPLPVILNLQEAGENVREGATYAMGGYALGPAVKAGWKGGEVLGKKIPGVRDIPGVGRATDWVTSMFPRTEKRAKEAAGRVLFAMVGDDPMIVKNIDEAKALEELIPGLKFDLGQLTGDVDVVRFMKEGIDDPGKLVKAQARQAEINLKAIQKFIETTKGKGTTRDFLKPLSTKEKILADAEAIAKSNLERQQGARKGQIGAMEGGAAIRGEMEAGELVARDAAAEKFAAVPEQNQIVDDLYDGFQNIMKPSHKAEGPDKFPKVLTRGIKIMKDSIKGDKVADDVLAKAEADIAKKGGKVKPKAKPTTSEPTMTLKDIQGLRSEILEDLRTAKDKGLPRSLRSRLAKAVELIDQKLGTSSGKEGKELQAAQKFFREEVIEKYGKGSVGKILRSEDTVQDAIVAGNFFKTGPAGEQAAVEFMNVMSDNPAAKTALKEHINQKVYDLRSDKTGEITKAALNRFLKLHRPALKKLGLENEYSTLMKAREAADKALAVSKEFEKSVASRVLNADVNDVVKKAFSGTGSKKQAAEELIEQFKFMDELNKTEPAAIKTSDGKIHTGVNHPLILSDLTDRPAYEFIFDSWDKKIRGFEEGFVTNNGRFITRKQAKAQYGFDHTMGDLSDRLVDTKKAINGLQNAMVDEILTEIPLDQPIRDLLTSDKMAAQFRKYDAALKVVFKDNPEKLKAMHVVRKAVKALEYKTGQTAGEGERYAADVVRRMAFLYGHSTVAAADIARKTVRVLKGISKEKIHKFINRGILDPEVAYSLMQAARGGSEKRMTQGIINSLVRLGLITQPKKDKEERH